MNAVRAKSISMELVKEPMIIGEWESVVTMKTLVICLDLAHYLKLPPLLNLELISIKCNKF